jgi:hypothetical protein
MYCHASDAYSVPAVSDECDADSARGPPPPPATVATSAPAATCSRRAVPLTAAAATEGDADGPGVGLADSRSLMSPAPATVLSYPPPPSPSGSGICMKITDTMAVTGLRITNCSVMRLHHRMKPWSSRSRGSQQQGIGCRSCPLSAMPSTTLASPPG